MSVPTAFIPVVPTTTFHARTHLPARTASSTPPRSTPCMAVDPDAPASDKYMSFIRPDRLNKAPVITINAFVNSDFNSVSVRMADFAADQAAGDAVKASVCVDDEAPPAVEKYAKYYDPATLHEAPFISMYNEGLPFGKHAVCLVQTSVPLRIPDGAALLGDVPPDTSLFDASFTNFAPCISVSRGTSDDDSTVAIDSVFQHLPLVAASEMLAKYRS